MPAFPRSLLAIARRQQGLLTIDDLVAHDLVGRRRARVLDSGLLVPVHRGVYRIASHAETFEQRCLAACLAATDAVLSGPTAGRLWRLRKVHTDGVHVIARRTIHLERVTAHRTDLLSTFDVVQRDGLRLLRPARLLCDLAWSLDDADLESVLEQMIERRMLSVQSAREAARRFTASGRPGSVRIARVVESRSAWLRPAESDIELTLWRALDRRGLRFRRQFELVLDSGLTIRIDLADPERRLGIEVDHVTWHGGRLDVQRDKRRDRESLRMGWTIARVTDEDVRLRLAEICDQLADIAKRCAPANLGRGIAS